jgi:hypothetical protein
MTQDGAVSNRGSAIGTRGTVELPTLSWPPDLFECVATEAEIMMEEFGLTKATRGNYRSSREAPQTNWVLPRPAERSSHLFG